MTVHSEYFILLKYWYDGDVNPKINFKADVLPDPFIPIKNVIK